MTTPILDRAEFRAWLVENSQEIVGKAIDCKHCPLAIFFQQVKGMKEAEIDGVTVQCNSVGTIELPDWADEFVGALDGTVEGYDPVDVRGATALAVLDSI